MTIEQRGILTVPLLMRRWASSGTRNTQRSCRVFDIGAVDASFGDVHVGLFRIGFEHTTFWLHNVQDYRLWYILTDQGYLNMYNKNKTTWVITGGLCMKGKKSDYVYVHDLDFPLISALLYGLARVDKVPS